MLESKVIWLFSCLMNILQHMSIHFLSIQLSGAAPHPLSPWHPVWSMEKMPSLTAGPGRYANVLTSVSVFKFPSKHFRFSICLLNSQRLLRILLLSDFFWNKSTRCVSVYSQPACPLFVSRFLCSMRRTVFGGTLVGDLWLLPTGSWLLPTASSMSSRQTWTHKPRNPTASGNIYQSRTDLLLNMQCLSWTMLLN